MDIEEIRAELTERFPQWSRELNVTEIKDVLGAFPTDNDGESIYYNSKIMQYYSYDAQVFFIAQQLLHIRFCHYLRGRGKNRKVWKRSSDAVVNAMLKSEGFFIPSNTPDIEEAADKSAEEMYEILINEDIPDEENNGENEAIEVKASTQSKSQSGGREEQAQLREIAELGIASVISGLREMLEPTMQLDFDWFPGSRIKDGMIREEFRAYPITQAEILLDTSASVDAELLRAFVRGVKGLMLSDSRLRVGCFDTRFYGFKDIVTEEDIQSIELRGFGGTDFNVAVSAFTGDAENQIIFTDGFAEMPEQRCDAVWVVYGNTVIAPMGGRVLYVKETEEKEKHEIDFLIT